MSSKACSGTGGSALKVARGNGVSVGGLFSEALDCALKIGVAGGVSSGATVMSGPSNFLPVLGTVRANCFCMPCTAGSCSTSNKTRDHPHGLFAGLDGAFFVGSTGAVRGFGVKIRCQRR